MESLKAFYFVSVATMICVLCVVVYNAVNISKIVISSNQLAFISISAIIPWVICYSMVLMLSQISTLQTTVNRSYGCECKYL